MLKPPLLSFLRQRFRLNWNGIHGAPHWSRVRRIGLKLAAETGANPRVVEAFAFLHDSCRHSDGSDPLHGSRAALLAEQINERFLFLQDGELQLLVEACIGHSDGQLSSDATVGTCWDADRLDLGRIGIYPKAELLCTPEARNPEIIAWAYDRSQHVAA